jgi:hypothetical protein
MEKHLFRSINKVCTLAFLEMIAAYVETESKLTLDKKNYKKTFI